MEQETTKAEFMEAFTEFGDAIFRFCLVKVSNQELAEDMTQEVFMRYWQYLRDGKEMQNTRAFLYTIANNMAKDWYKKKKSVSLDDQLDNAPEPAGNDLDPEIAAQYREVLSAIDDLEENDRAVLILRYVEGLPPKEIAVILEESANVVSVRINRAEKRLRDKIHHE